MNQIRVSRSVLPARYLKAHFGLDVEVVGTVRVRLTEADLSKFPKKKARKEDRFFSKDTWYIVDMICDVCVADEVGVLNFVVTCQGQPCGTAELVFARE